MSKTTHVVEGEASESDSDIEMAKSPDTEVAARAKTCVVAGEAPESDDESKISPQIEEEEESSPPKSVTRSPNKIMYNSLLHQKLWECNVSLRATIEGLVRHTVDISVDKLTRADQSLLTVQESMRATNANLNLARARLHQIKAELQKANCAEALPTVKVEL